LGFLLRNKSVFAIPKSSNRHHVEENAAAEDLRLSHMELDRIDRAFPLGAPKELPML
jgi:diketogulonate reductase-like aldo/keto reductase